MKQAWLRWIMYSAAIFITGPIAGTLMATVRAPDGGPDASPLTGAAPLYGLFIGLAVVGIAGALGLLAARLTNGRTAMTTVGLTLAWAAYRAGDVEPMLRASESVSPLWRASIEGGLLGAAAIVVMIAIHAMTRREHQESAEGSAPGLASTLRGTFGGLGVAMAVLAAILSGAAAVWLAGNSGLKGQTIGAALIAGLVGAAAGRLVDAKVPASAFMLPAVLLAIAGPAAAAMALSSNIVETVNRGGLFPVARLMPLDWIAGAFLGIPIGIAWTASMVEKRA